jgi:hypothetical protein
MLKSDHAMTSVDWQPYRTLVTGYYDGPTEGVIDFGDDVGIYCFKAVEFDFDREMRVLKLTRVFSERSEFESVLTTLSASLGPPKWPVWVPIWEFSDESAKAVAESALDTLCATGETVLMVLTDDTTDKCYAIHKIDEGSSSDVKHWLSFFAKNLS